MGVQVLVVVEGDGELRGGVDDIEGEGVVEEGLPSTWGGGLDDGFSVGVVPCDVSGDAREAEGELGLIWRALGCHFKTGFVYISV